MLSLFAILLGMTACAPVGDRPIEGVAGTGGVVIQPPEGPPAPMADLLAQSVAAALVQRGYVARAVIAGASTETNADFQVSGTAEALEPIHAPTVAALHWVLHDGEGKEIAYLTQGVRGSPDSWTYGSPAMLKIVGEEAAADFSIFLGRPSNAPTIPGMPVIPAQPAFEPEMLEPGMPESQISESQIPGQELGRINADGIIEASGDTAAEIQGVANVAALLPPPPTPPPLPVTSGLKNIRDFGLWLDEVTGAPGDGNAALTQAIFEDLTRNKLPFALTPGLASHYVQGVVDVAVRSATQEHITIVWVVSNAQGEEIGRVTQRNDIVRGSLHGEWGDTAVYIARGGLEGILAILERDLETVFTQ